jgi:hypothetical protein
MKNSNYYENQIDRFFKVYSPKSSQIYLPKFDFQRKIEKKQMNKSQLPSPLKAYRIIMAAEGYQHLFYYKICNPTGISPYPGRSLNI